MNRIVVVSVTEPLLFQCDFYKLNATGSYHIYWALVEYIYRKILVSVTELTLFQCDPLNKLNAQ